MTTLDEIPELDLTVDGADEIDPELRLIKGGGGALLREKIVAAASRRMAVIADASKLVRAPRRLSAAGRGRPVRPHGHPSPHRDRRSKSLGLSGPIVLRGGASPFRDRRRPLHPRLRVRRHSRPGATWPTALSAIPGVVEHGLFIGYARTAFVAARRGVEVLGRTAESHHKGVIRYVRHANRLRALLLAAALLSWGRRPAPPTRRRLDAAHGRDVPALAGRDCGRRRYTRRPSGVKESIALIVPAMMTELERNVTTRGPRSGTASARRLRAIKPEFDKSAQQTYAKAAALARARHVREGDRRTSRRSSTAPPARSTSRSSRSSSKAFSDVVGAVARANCPPTSWRRRVRR